MTDDSYHMPIRIGIGIGISIGKIFSSVLGIEGIGKKWYQSTFSQHVYKSAWTPLTDRMRKCILREDNEHDKYAVKIDCISIQKEDEHIKRDIENKLISLHVWHYFNV